MLLATVLIGLSSFLLLLYFVQKQRNISNGLKNFVCPPGPFLYKHLYLFEEKVDVLPKMVDLVKQYGGLLKLEMIYGLPFLLVAEKNFLKLLLGTTTIMNKDETYKHTHRWLGAGLLTSEKEKWEKSRRIINPAFHFQLLEKYVGNFHSPVSILINKLSEKVGDAAFDIFPYITLCTLDVICETAMGTKINAQKNSDSAYVRSVKEMCGIIQDRSQSIWKFFDILYVFSKEFRTEKKALKILHGFTNEVIARKKKEKDNSNNDVDKKRLSLLDLLLEAKIDDRPMSDEEITEEVSTFMFAGHDTTASATSFTLYCLSTHPEIQQKVYEEVLEIFGDDGRDPTYQDLQQMKYFNLVIKEALRLYPPVPVFNRSSKIDIQLGDHIIPKRISVCTFAYGLHRNPAYFTEPEKFIPARFEADIEPYTYMPFSTGPRNCIGQRFAVLEIKTIISKILRTFIILPAPNYQLQPVANVVLGSANGIQVVLRDRRKYQ